MNCILHPFDCLSFISIADNQTIVRPFSSTSFIGGNFLYRQQKKIFLQGLSSFQFENSRYYQIWKLTPHLHLTNFLFNLLSRSFSFTGGDALPIATIVSISGVTSLSSSFLMLENSKKLLMIFPLTQLFSAYCFTNRRTRRRTWN